MPWHARLHARWFSSCRSGSGRDRILRPEASEVAVAAARKTLTEPHEAKDDNAATCWKSVSTMAAGEAQRIGQLAAATCWQNGLRQRRLRRQWRPGRPGWRECIVHIVQLAIGAHPRPHHRRDRQVFEASRSLSREVRPWTPRRHAFLLCAPTPKM